MNTVDQGTRYPALQKMINAYKARLMTFKRSFQQKISTVSFHSQVPSILIWFIVFVFSPEIRLTHLLLVSSCLLCSGDGKR